MSDEIELTRANMTNGNDKFHTKFVKSKHPIYCHYIKYSLSMVTYFKTLSPRRGGNDENFETQPEHTNLVCIVVIVVPRSKSSSCTLRQLLKGGN